MNRFILRRFFRQLGHAFKRPREADRFLRESKGVVHVGANTGQERDVYLALGLKVVWVEPIPEVFRELSRNILGYPGQQAIEALVADRDGEEHVFNVASNRGQSSSILPLEGHRDLWPQVTYERAIRIKGWTLPTLLAAHRVDVAGFDTLVMDTQGSELRVLQGAAPLLDGLRFVKTEAADFEAYGGCCRVDDLAVFLGGRGFREIFRQPFPGQVEGKRYYDVVFQRTDPPPARRRAP